MDRAHIHTLRTYKSAQLNHINVGATTPTKGYGGASGRILPCSAPPHSGGAFIIHSLANYCPPSRQNVATFACALGKFSTRLKEDVQYNCVCVCVWKRDLRSLCAFVVARARLHFCRYFFAHVRFWLVFICTCWHLLENFGVIMYKDVLIDFG